MKGIAEVHDANVIYAASILKDSWEGILAHRIMHYWVKPNVLPPSQKVDLQNAIDKVHFEDRNELDDF